MHWCVKSKFSLSRQQNIFPPRNPLPRPSLLPAHPRLVLSAHVVITGRECTCPYHYPHSWCLYIFYYVCMHTSVCVCLYRCTEVQLSGVRTSVIFRHNYIFSILYTCFGCISVEDKADRGNLSVRVYMRHLGGVGEDDRLSPDWRCSLHP